LVLQIVIFCDFLHRGYTSPLNKTDNEPQAVASLKKNRFSLGYLKTYLPFIELLSLINHTLVLIPKQVKYVIYYCTHTHTHTHTYIQYNILIYIQQDATLHCLFYLETALHVSDGTVTHHQEHKQMYLQHLVFVTPLLLSAVIVE